MRNVCQQEALGERYETNENTFRLPNRCFARTLACAILASLGWLGSSHAQAQLTYKIRDGTITITGGCSDNLGSSEPERVRTVEPFCVSPNPPPI